MLKLDRSVGRSAFGADPAVYDSIRPSYPQWIFDLIRSRCEIGAGSSVFEIGAGTGIATRPLLDLGVSKLVAIEPDPRLAEFLRHSSNSPALQILETPFEDVELPSNSFDFGFAATSFHWLEEGPALKKIAQWLKPGGGWMSVWHVFGDSRPDPFHDATTHLFPRTESPSAGSTGVQFAFDAAARIAALEAAGFENPEHRAEQWTLELNPEEVVRMYSTYSNVVCHLRSEELLAELGRIAEADFGGRVVRDMTTVLYLAQKAE